MNFYYDAYSTSTGANELAHAADVELTADHFKRLLLPLLEAAGCDLQAARVLEFGAGWGRNLLALQSAGLTKTFGVDISPEQVAIGRSLGLSNLDLVGPDEDLLSKFGCGSFDIVLAIDVIEHLDFEHLAKFARTSSGLLAPGGLLVVQVPNDLAPFNPVRAGDLTHLRAFTAASVKQLLVLAGAQPVYIIGMPFPSKWATRTLRTSISFLLRALIRFLSTALYGRQSARAHVEPNILGIGRR